MPATIVTAIACNGLVLLLTPTGALPSPRWRWWAGVTAATPVAVLLVVTLVPRPAGRLVQAVDSPLDLHALDGVRLVAYRAAFTVAIIALVVAAASVVVRFRRARGIERQQLRWVKLATVVMAPLFVVNLAAEEIDLDELSSELLAVIHQTMEPATASLWLRPPTQRAQQLAGIGT